MVKKILSILWIGLMALFYSPSQTYAHASPVEYYPQASSILQDTPSEIVIQFSERVEPSASSMVVYGPSGDKVNLEVAQVDPSDQYRFLLPISTANSQFESGTYTVSWQVVSVDDGHFTKGAFNFSLGEETAGVVTTNQFEIQHNSSVVEGILTSIELYSYGILLAFAVLQLLLITPSFYALLSKNSQLGKSYFWRSSVLLFIVGISGIASYIIYIYFKSLELQSFQLIPLDSAYAMFNQTVAGAFTWYKLFAFSCALLCIYVLQILAFHKKVSLKTLRIATSMAILLLLATGYMRAQVSHAAASSFLPTFSIFVNFLQLLAKGTWVGSLVVFGWIFLPVTLQVSQIKKNGAEAILKYSDKVFGILLSICIGLTGFTGMYIIWLHLKDPVNIVGTAWGELFVILSAGMLLMITLRLFNQILLPWLAPRWRWLHRVSAVSWPVEQASGLLLMVATGFIIITTPPLHAIEYTQFSEPDANQTAVSMAVHPYDESQVLLTFADTQVETAVATITNQELRIGPLVVETEQRFPGGFVFEQDELSPGGKWQIAITGHRKNQYDVTAQFELDTTTDLSPIASDGFLQHKLWFTLFFASGAVGAVFFGIILVLIVLYLHNSSNTYSGIAEISLVFESLHKNNKTLHYVSKLIAFILFVLLLSLFYSLYMYGLRSNFRRTCEANGHMWNQSVPLMYGSATNPVAVAGCSLGAGAGQFHFAKAEEYFHFMRPFQGSAQLDVSNKIAGETSQLTFKVSELIDGQTLPLSQVLVDHDRLIHVIIIHENFEEFRHVHPEDQGVTLQNIESGEFSFNHTFEQSGRYVVAMDIKVRGQYFSEQFVVEIETSTNQEGQEYVPNFEPLPVDGAMQTVQEIGQYRVALEKPEKINAGEIIPISYSYQKNGEALTTLQKYLGAPMHVAVVRDDLRHFLHAHGLLPSTWFDYLTQGNTIPTSPENLKAHVHKVIPENFGPQIDTYLFFPVPGRYHLFSEVADGDTILVSHFMVEVH